jgi:hypothetical protein
MTAKMAKANLFPGSNVALMPMRLLLTLISIFSLFSTLAQDSSIYILDKEAYLLGKISNHQVFTGPQEITFTLRGNTIFAGEDPENGEIVFLYRGDDLFSRKAGLVYEKDTKTIRYITRNGGVFLGDHPIDEINERMLDFVADTPDTYSVLNGLSGDTLGMVQGPGITAIDLIAAAHLFIVTYNLDQAVADRLEQMAVASLQIASGGIMYPYVDNGMRLLYEWDGRTLKKMVNGFPTGEWRFDGHRIQATMTIGTGSEWTWEGGILKPSWDNEPTLQWTWNDNILQPYWDGNPDKMWILDGNTMRPMWNADPTLQWVVEGEIPSPLIALVALGIAR